MLKFVLSHYLFTFAEPYEGVPSPSHAKLIIVLLLPAAPGLAFSPTLKTLPYTDLLLVCLPCLGLVPTDDCRTAYGFDDGKLNKSG
jgi:hypothetical protein